MRNIKQLLIDKANSLGFPLVGFAKAVSLDDDAAYYRKWVAEGNHGAMGWMSNGIADRATPQALLPDAKSVIVLAMPYSTPFQNTIPAGGKCEKISRYAWGWDYHDIVKPKLYQLNEIIREIIPEAQFYNSVDSGMVLEKAWAIRAGLGWRGKNSLLLTERFGSYIFLGVIYTDIIFEYDTPIANLCGKCNACQKACPTSAILQTSAIDANKCLSHWLNEASRNTAIPVEITAQNPGWAFACDACQEVCPYNQSAEMTDNTLFYPRLCQTNLDTEVIARMSQEDFSRRFKGSPVKRAKLVGLKRNMNIMEQ